MPTVYLNLPFQTTFAISTNCDELINLICLKYGVYASFEPPASADQKISVQRSQNIYQFSTDSFSSPTDAPLSAIDKYLFDNTVYDQRILALHGAAVEYDGYCHLFLAATTSGKTTLTSYLTSNGFGYLTDDCILLDRSDFKIHPFTTPIQLREGGLAILNQYNSVPEDIRKLDEPPALTRYVYTPEGCVHRPVPLKNVYFIKLTEGENYLSDMSTTERMTELLKSPITPYGITKEYLCFISQLAKTNCQRLFYSDMNFVKDVITNG